MRTLVFIVDDYEHPLHVDALHRLYVVRTSLRRSLLAGAPSAVGRACPEGWHTAPSLLMLVPNGTRTERYTARMPPTPFASPPPPPAHAPPPPPPPAHTPPPPPRGPPRPSHRT